MSGRSHAGFMPREAAGNRCANRGPLDCCSGNLIGGTRRGVGRVTAGGKNAGLAGPGTAPRPARPRGGDYTRDTSRPSSVKSDWLVRLSPALGVSADRSTRSMLKYALQGTDRA